MFTPTLATNPIKIFLRRYAMRASKGIQMVYIFSRFREIAMGVGTQFVVIIRLHGTSRVEDVISEMGSPLLQTAARATLGSVCYFSELST